MMQLIFTRKMEPAGIGSWDNIFMSLDPVFVMHQLKVPLGAHVFVLKIKTMGDGIELWYRDGVLYADESQTRADCPILKALFHRRSRLYFEVVEWE